MTKSLTEQQIRKIIENVTGKAAKVCEQKFYGKPKSLTEQWREGTLPCGAYYVNRLNEILVYLVTYEDNKNTHEIYEVLAPVPSYSEYQALKDNCETVHNCYKGANKKIKQLQKQLDEANKLLKYCCANYESSLFGATITEDGEILPKGPVWNYLKKWGVK